MWLFPEKIINRTVHIPVEEVVRNLQIFFQTDSSYTLFLSKNHNGDYIVRLTKRLNPMSIIAVAEITGTITPEGNNSVINIAIKKHILIMILFYFLFFILTALNIAIIINFNVYKFLVLYLFLLFIYGMFDYSFSEDINNISNLIDKISY